MEIRKIKLNQNSKSFVDFSLKSPKNENREYGKRYKKRK